MDNEELELKYNSSSDHKLDHQSVETREKWIKILDHNFCQMIDGSSKKKIQDDLKSKLVIGEDFDWNLDTNSPKCIKYIGGMDISFYKGKNEDACCGLVVLSYPEFKVIEKEFKYVKLKVPYIPGFLAFREIEFLVELLNEFRKTHPESFPQLIFTDGNGILHPREFGIACHLGVLTGIPTIGCSKNLYCMDGLETKSTKKNFIQNTRVAGDFIQLIGASGKCYGIAYKSSNDCTNPVFLSIGHKVSLETVIKLARACSLYKIPEPIRKVDILSREWIRKNSK